jgi:hypothetical protein
MPDAMIKMSETVGVFCSNERGQYIFWTPLKIQISLQYSVDHKKLLLAYHIYAASQFFARALSCLEL